MPVGRKTAFRLLTWVGLLGLYPAADAGARTENRFGSLHIDGKKAGQIHYTVEYGETGDRQGRAQIHARVRRLLGGREDRRGDGRGVSGVPERPPRLGPAFSASLLSVLSACRDKAPWGSSPRRHSSFDPGDHLAF
ncbi:MAG: hypothetical protein ACREA0_03955 [bacterium]